MVFICQGNSLWITVLTYQKQYDSVPTSMKIEHQVSNRELSKELRDLGVPQESYFSWEQHWSQRWKLYPDGKHWWLNFSEKHISAYTTSELGEIINEKLGVTRTHHWKTFLGVKWFGSWSTVGEVVEADTEANCRAKLLIYLIKNNLINIEDLT